MLISLATKKPLTTQVLTPLDFYRFRHSEELVRTFDTKRAVARPLWIVGVSPFDIIISADEGHVVHLGSPRFTARWTMVEKTMSQIANPDFFDEDVGIMIHETLFMDNDAERVDEWLLEAACAVAYSKGLIAVTAPDESH